MPKQNCILPTVAEKLREAFRAGKINIADLYNLGSSEKRIEFLAQYVGDNAKLLNTSLERAFISPNQKLALRNWVYKNVADVKPLYKDLTLEQSKKLAELDVPTLKKMNSADRIKEFRKYVGEALSESLNKRFEALKKSGKLELWESRAMGTETVKDAKKLKGELAKLEALDDLGVLSPKQAEDFMGSFVESKLGVSVTLEQSQEISRLVDKSSELLESISKKGDFTFNNKKEILEFFETKSKLDATMARLGEVDIVGTVADIMRANILASPRILKNSFLYQALPGAERAITKRLVSGNFSDGIFESGIIEKLQAKLSGIVPNKSSREFIKEQTKMALEIYHKTGYDISRMETLDVGKRIFGEKFGVAKGGDSILNKYYRLTNLAPKWMAGGTDTLFANIGRADTSTMLSREIAFFEAGKMKFAHRTAKTEWIEKRATQLLKDSYSFSAKDPKAVMIRARGIKDAHRMNGTQMSVMADKLSKLRDWMNLGSFKLGKVLVPFLKIPATVAATGFKTASGIGIYNAVKKISAATKLKGTERSAEMAQGVDSLIRYLGFTGAAVFLTTMLDTDDYIGAWETQKFGEYDLDRAEGGSTSMIRIGGVWIPLRFLPIIDIPIAAIMSGRQAKERGEPAIAGYAKGIAGQILQVPGIKDLKNLFDKTSKAIKAKGTEDILNALGLDGKSIFNWAKVRAVPSVISYDLYNELTEAEEKFDYLGRKIEKANFIGIRKDTSNELTEEIRRLNNVGMKPVTSDPSGEDSLKLAESLGVEAYIKLLQEKKRNLAQENMELIETDSYKQATDEEKKNMLNKNRTKYLLNSLK